MYISVHVKWGWIYQRMSAQVHTCARVLFSILLRQKGGTNDIKAFSFHGGC